MKNNLKSLKNILLTPLRLFFKLTLKRKIIVIILGIITFAAISQTVSNITKPSPYTTEKVKRANITEIVTESGNIVASGKNDVYSPTNGVVTETYVDNGSRVTEGQKLYMVKSSATDQEAQAANANYLSAVATLNAAEAGANTLRADMYTKWDTFRNLATNSTYEKGDQSPNTEQRMSAEFQSTQDTWLAAEKKFKDQQTAIQQARSLVASTYNLYKATQDAVVTAPVAGTIENLAVTKGSTVSIKSSTLTRVSSPTLIISSDSTSEVAIKLSETDISKVEQGQRAIVSVNSVSDKTYKGKVARVDSIGTDTQGVVTYSVYVEITNPDNKIRQGMTVDADIVTKEINSTISVPNSSIKPYQGGKAVRIPDSSIKEKYRYVPVVVGIRGTERTQIIKGVSEGQTVITAVLNENIKRPGLFGN